MRNIPTEEILHNLQQQKIQYISVLETFKFNNKLKLMMNGSKFFMLYFNAIPIVFHV
jgi:hypothetical protein